MLISLPLVIVHPALPLIGVALLALSNLSIGLWSYRKEREFLIVSPVLASLRSVAGTFGVLKYCMDKVLP